MFGAVAFTYGMLLSFVLSGASRNRKLQRANPAVLTYTGYVLVGMTAALSMATLGYAAWTFAAGQGFGQAI
jgi:hypothetical protein